MTTTRTISISHIEWQGITIEISFEPHWLASGPEDPSLYRPAHLQIRSIRPDRAELPITETGHKSHFIDLGRVEAARGPVAYAIAWLDAVAAEPWWRKRQIEGRQLSLF